MYRFCQKARAAGTASNSTNFNAHRPKVDTKVTIGRHADDPFNCFGDDCADIADAFFLLAHLPALLALALLCCCGCAAGLCFCRRQKTPQD